MTIPVRNNLTLLCNQLTDEEDNPAISRLSNLEKLLLGDDQILMFAWANEALLVEKSQIAIIRMMYRSKCYVADEPNLCIRSKSVDVLLNLLKEG